MSGLNFVSLRLANVTGPSLSIGPIPTFYKRLKERKSCFCSDTRRDFLDMSDFIFLMNHAIKEEAPGGIFNVSTGVGNTIKDIFDTVVDYLGVELDGPVSVVPPNDDDVQSVVLNPSETEKAFGWKAKVNFKDTICNMLRWYDSMELMPFIVISLSQLKIMSKCIEPNIVKLYGAFGKKSYRSRGHRLRL